MEQKDIWTQQSLEEMIANGAEESIHLDFKAAASLGKEDGRKKEICKDISAFANSDGGVIIYGISEVDHRADSFSFIDGNDFTKEWLEQVIKDRIQRRIEGIRIHPVRFDNDIKKTVYVVDIPVSYLAPHMTKENRFYKRYNFMSSVMEEYEVRNTYDRKKKVKLKLGDILISVPNSDTWVDDEEVEFHLQFYVINVGESMADTYKLRCRIDDINGCVISHLREQNINIVSAPDNAFIIATTKTFPVYSGDVVNALEFTVKVPIAKIYDLFTTFPIQTILFMEGDTEIENFDLADRFQNLYKSLIEIIEGPLLPEG